MTIREDILTCVESEVWLNDFHLSAKDDLVLAGSDDWSISKRTLQGGPSAGIDVVTLNNGILSIDVMPTRGMGFWKGTYRGKPLGWKSPVRFPVHPSLVSLDSQRGSGWLTGFNEWMCRCGLKSIGPATNALSEEGGVKSTEHSSTLHGRIANIPAHFVSTMVDTADGGRVLCAESPMNLPCLAPLCGSTLRSIWLPARTRLKSTTASLTAVTCRAKCK